MGTVRSTLQLVEHHGLRLVLGCFIGRRIWGWVWINGKCTTKNLCNCILEPKILTEHWFKCNSFHISLNIESYSSKNIFFGLKCMLPCPF